MGRTPYEVVLRLFILAEDNWPRLDAAYYQVNMMALPLDRFLNCVYAWYVDRQDAKGYEEFTAWLTAPIPGETRRVSETSAEEEGSSFMDAMQTLRVK